MSDSLAVSLRNISKKYRLFGSVKERFLEAMHPFDKKYHHEFWALKNVSFDVRKGSTVGIIGRNGAGKSTLLQIITSILQPTSGSVEVNGKISALLALGAGFKPEVTGRENVLFQGQIMGFTRKEMFERLPVIEEFADIGEFINQPVKIYSSGMLVRLAFAAAINVDPDILIIDEALAVGDAKFRHKCFLKFQEIKEKGITILLVSHAVEWIVQHCQAAILLEKGKLLKMGDPHEVYCLYRDMIISETNKESLKEKKQEPTCIASDLKTDATDFSEDMERAGQNKLLQDFINSYNQDDRCPSRRSYNENEIRSGNYQSLIIDYLLVCDDIIDPFEVESGAWVDIYIKTLIKVDVHDPSVGFAIRAQEGAKIYGTNAKMENIDIEPLTAGEIVIYKSSVKLDVSRGDYFITLGVGAKTEKDFIFMDTRNALIHLKVTSATTFGGLVRLKSSLGEVKRTRPLEQSGVKTQLTPVERT